MFASFIPSSVCVSAAFSFHYDYDKLSLEHLRNICEGKCYVALNNIFVTMKNIKKSALHAINHGCGMNVVVVVHRVVFIPASLS